MATIERGNWSFRDPGDDISDGSTINGGNFSQTAPDTAIMAGKMLTINGGNFTNVRKDTNWTINGGNWTQKLLCSHLHPEWIQFGLEECAENCSHVVETIEIVGGSTVYQYADEVQ